MPDMYTLGTLKGQYISAGAGRYDIGNNKAYPLAKLGTGGVAVTGNQSRQLYYTFIQNSSVINDYNFNTRMNQGNFTPAQAVAIDQKLDDGIPSTGTIVATTKTVQANSTGIPFTLDPVGNCVSSTTAYNIDSTADMPCRLVIKSNYN